MRQCSPFSPFRALTPINWKNVSQMNVLRHALDARSLETVQRSSLKTKRKEQRKTMENKTQNDKERIAR